MTESVDALLARLSLSKYAAIFVDEAITDVELLTSMGGDLLLGNMAEIGVAAADAEILRAALFDSRRSSDGELRLESNAAGDDDSGGELLLEENDGAPTGTPAPAPAAPAREEDAAALRDAERLLRPLAQFDLPELKRRLRPNVRRVPVGIEADGILKPREGALAVAQVNAEDLNLADDIERREGLTHGGGGCIRREGHRSGVAK